jgi:hypothetical protein
VQQFEQMEETSEEEKCSSAFQMRYRIRRHCWHTRLFVHDEKDFFPEFKNSQSCATRPPSECGNDLPAEISFKVNCFFSFVKHVLVVEQCHEDSSTIRGTHGANVELFIRVFTIWIGFVLRAFPLLFELEGIIFVFCSISSTFWWKKCAGTEVSSSSQRGIHHIPLVRTAVTNIITAFTRYSWANDGSSE